uniref:Uncharacterized protein n=1 Tax=Glossina austeni TaxID=7395 RepID=A0A1A9UDS0_GLOAU
MDKICKWLVRYDGECCALEFIDRVEELCEVYDLPLDIVPWIIMELFSGKAAIWPFCECNNQKVPFCWDYGRPVVLTKDCCPQNTRGQTQARGMGVKKAQREWLSRAPKTIISTTGNTLVASLIVGVLTTTGVVDT